MMERNDLPPELRVQAEQYLHGTPEGRAEREARRAALSTEMSGLVAALSELAGVGSDADSALCQRFEEIVLRALTEAEGASITHRDGTPRAYARNLSKAVALDLLSAVLLADRRRHRAEVEQLREWKDSAMAVLGEWDAVHAALGSPGDLGESKAAAVETEVTRLRYLLAKHGGWTYFREEDPDNPIRRDHTSRMGRLPPGKYIEVCSLCGAYRHNGHTAECEIGQALGITPEPGA